MKKAIAMKCTQEQFDSIKDKLVGCKIAGISDFLEMEYLINNRNDEENSITNYLNIDKYEKGRTVYETWNEQVFLEACDIEKIFKGSELQYWCPDRLDWINCVSHSKYRLKLNNSAEIEALEQQKLEIDKQIEKLR